MLRDCAMMFSFVMGKPCLINNQSLYSVPDLDHGVPVAAAGRNNTGYADNCSSSVPATSSWIVMAPSNTDPTGQGLT